MNYWFPSNGFALETLFPKLPFQSGKTAVDTRECIQHFEPCCVPSDEEGTGNACVEIGGKHYSHSIKVSWALHLVPGVLGICVGWGESPWKPTDPDRITCTPQMEETPIPQIITQVPSLLEQERTMSMVMRALPPWQTASCRCFPLPKENKARKRGRAQLKLNCTIKLFSTTNWLASDSAIELKQC